MTQENTKRQATSTRFQGQVVLITGGGGGIGIALGNRFAREGARVVLLDVDEMAAGRGVDTLAKDGLEAVGMAADVASQDSVDAAFDSAAQRCGSVDVLIAAAGIRPLSDVLHHSEADWDRCVAVNLTGVFTCAKAAARHMLPRKRGAIVNIASVNGVRAVVGMTAYNATKAGVISLTQSLACEFAPNNVRVNAIFPAQIETPMIKDQVGQERSRREERIPLGRYGRPEEIAAAACFLASDEASFITGHGLAVDGGYLAFGFRPAAF